MKNLIVTLALIISSCFSSIASDVPSFNNYVNDHGKVLSSNELLELNKGLKLFDDSTSTQIAVLTIPSHNDRTEGPLFDLCRRVFTTWGIGQKDKNNGVLLVIVKHLASKNGPGIRIYTGYGLEGALPDAICNRIIEETIRPLVNQGKYYEAIDSGLNRIKSYVKDEYVVKKQSQDTTVIDIIAVILLCALCLVVLFVIVASIWFGDFGSSSSSSSGSSFSSYSSSDSDSSSGFGGFGGGDGGGGGAGD